VKISAQRWTQTISNTARMMETRPRLDTDLSTLGMKTSAHHHRSALNANQQSAPVMDLGIPLLVSLGVRMAITQLLLIPCGHQKEVSDGSQICTTATWYTVIISMVTIAFQVPEKPYIFVRVGTCTVLYGIMCLRSPSLCINMFVVLEICTVHSNG
jgi:hypothetical protein